MARSARRTRRTNAAARNTTAGNSATGVAYIKMSPAQARKCADYFCCLLMDGSFTWLTISGALTYYSLNEIGLFSGGANNTTADTQAPTRQRRSNAATASKATVTRARGRPRRAASANASATGRKVPRQAAGQKADLNAAILAVMPETNPIQQSELIARVQRNYPNTWPANIIGAALARLRKAGTLVSQGATGNKAVWGYPQSQQMESRQAA
jgi:hypothetical protein